jgi:hypothetical protein
MEFINACSSKSTTQEKEKSNYNIYEKLRLESQDGKEIKQSCLEWWCGGVGVTEYICG